MKLGLVVAAALWGLAAQPADDRFPLLTRLSIPVAALPPGCSIPPAVRLPIPGAENRRVTTDPRAFVLVDKLLTERYGKHVAAAYYAVYKEANELGVMGWAFDTPASAKEAHGRLADKYPDRFRWWRKGKYVICLWRDAGTTDKCLDAFAAFIQKAVDDFGTPL
jgi:hypothetical protein